MFSSITDTLFGTTDAVVEPSCSEAKAPGSPFSSVTDTSSDDSDSGDEGVSSLLERFPTLSEQDCVRFKENFGADNDGSEKDVLQKLEEYVQFRAMYGLDTPKADFSTDEEDWEWAAATAMKAAKTSEGGLIPGLDGLALEDRAFGMEKLPQLCFVHTNQDGSPVLSKDGCPIIHYLSARLDLSVSEEIYALAIAIYLERKFHQFNLYNTRKGVVLLVDVRKGAGWPNHNVLSVVSFLRTLTNTLHKIHPGRMEKLVIYTVPYACVYVFQMMKGYLPTSIAESITLINGPDGIHDPAPTEALAQYVDEDILEKMEETREANFLE